MMEELWVSYPPVVTVFPEHDAYLDGNFIAVVPEMTNTQMAYELRDRMILKEAVKSDRIDDLYLHVLWTDEPFSSIADANGTFDIDVVAPMYAPALRNNFNNN